MHIIINNFHLQSIWKRLYSCSSAKEGGTLYQLRNLINRRNITSYPSKNVAPSEDFVQTVLEAHILAAAMEAFQMEALNDTPKCAVFTEEMTPSQTQDAFLKAASIVVKQFVDIAFCHKNHVSITDGVHCYAKELISLGLLMEEFNDSIREEDGDRILRCWKFLFLIFRATGRTNYAIEAFTLLCQYNFLFTPRMAEQLKWSRTVNMHGKIFVSLMYNAFLVSTYVATYTCTCTILVLSNDLSPIKML